MPFCSQSFSLRAGTQEDLHAVCLLNRLCFEECWSLQSLYSALESGYDLLLCEQAGRLAGFILSLTVLDEIQIMQVAVSPDCRRMGVARRMSRYLIDHAAGIQAVSLEVRLSNAPARALYASLGFSETGYRKQYYAPNAAGICEDAVLLMMQPAAGEAG
ncbi:MAG: ribosomal-protein-alanine N-acetyltransferase [Zetaproteobacteria bacterium CG_4_9_14_3_um_filter_54_145]|nr:MAG: ribosomal-protein-alanine N-acetyltransferase [Zetaproteobacteria bacterium CG_4_10_14_3_um_filter_54_28]PJA27910.1 MAG: ribosomal-protein-alanine N-acetyltransferase [Zetaproteobacteria bacterium CG_4_9_14_3_um_filter_54_145]